jgi:hypothetical protein
MYLLEVLFMKEFKRTSLFAFLTGIFVVFVSPVILFAQSKTINTENLIRESEVIVHGNVSGRMAEWTSKHDKIQTRITVAVDQTIKGTVPGDAMTVIIPGGEIDGIGEWYSHIARFDDNEEVILFAKKDKNGIFRVTGGESGKFTVRKDARTGSKSIPNIGTLEVFTQKIKNTVKKQQAEIGKAE